MSKLPFFEKAGHGNIKFDNTKRDFSRILFSIYFALIFILFIIFALRLFQLTIVKGNYYKRLSEENRIKELIIEPNRGKLIDRKGFTIVESLPADIEKNKDRLLSGRIYKEGEAIAPIVGYRQIADKSEIKNNNCLNKLKLGDKIGKKGVEKSFDCSLRGINGKKMIEVDARGNYLRTLSISQPEDGQTIQLSIDLKLQKKAYELIKDKRASIVAIKPQTGEIILLVSSPSYDPQSFEDDKKNDLSKYFTDENKPLFNRATSGTYPSGSTFKPFVAAAALEEKKIDEKK